MFPLTPEELGKDFSLEQVLAVGSLPVVWTADDRMATLEAYVQTYLREEIRAEAVLRNLPGFLRFLPVAALFHGQVVNVSGIARDAGTARTTVEGYLEILEDTLLTIRLPAYEAKLRVRERKHPKLYWVDPGIVRAVKKQLGPVHSEERGALLEGWILSLLRTSNETKRIFDDVYYWSPVDIAVEVDFLLRRGRDLMAIEVKSAKRFHSGMLSGLRAIESLPGLRRRILIYVGARRMESPEGIEIVPVADFLSMLSGHRLWR
jgi:predicted AAA+ superfamily ATPase